MSRSDNMSRSVGALGALAGIVFLLLATSTALAMRGSGCSDGQVLKLHTGWVLMCHGTGCPPGEFCVVYTSLSGDTTTQECVCDPTPASTTDSDESGDETSEMGVSLCKTKLHRQGASQWVTCDNVTCASTCTPDHDWNHVFCDCP